jgi:UDP-3-O-[3-hydroxymyristoyl] glucosamine N-acyltransferase
MKLKVEELARRLGAELVGDGDGWVDAVGPIEAAEQSAVTFVTDEMLLRELRKTRAAAVIVGRRVEGVGRPQLVVKDVNAALIKALSIFAPELKAAPEGVDPSAKVGRDVKIGEGVSVGACVVIDDKVEIGENSVIGAGCKIGENSKLGKDCRLDCNVVVYHNCVVGNSVVIQANSTIGSVGFGYYFIDGAHRLIPHNGGVVIEDFVEIGANCCIDRAKFGNTRIGAGTKIDNLVQIAHNVIIGRCCLIAGLVGIAGSCKVGDGVVLGGQAGIADNLKIGDGVMVAAQSGVTHDIAAGQRIFGTPATEQREAFKTIGLTRRLPKTVELLRELGERVKKLEASKDDTE